MRTVLDDWQWRYKVGFDDKLYDSVMEATSSLAARQEQTIQREIVDVCRQFISLDAALDVLANRKTSPENLLSNIDSERLLYIPETLFKHFEAKIERTIRSIPTQDKTGRWKQRLSTLVEQAHADGIRPPHYKVLQRMFGEEPETLLDRTGPEKDDCRMPASSTYVAPGELPDLVDWFVATVRQDPEVTEWFDELSLDSFEVILHREKGYGEYWPKMLQEEGATNKLILYINPETLKKENLISTLAHELLPGHAHFYWKMEASQAPFLDYGAMGLIEGWATWCEWHVMPNPFSRYARDGRLWMTRHLDGSAAAQEIRRAGHTIELPEGQIEREVLNYFQYPGYRASYSLGGLWFEQRFQDQRPADFLSEIRKRPWGDFFRVWQSGQN